MTEEEPELTEVTHVGESRAKKFKAKGYHVSDLAQENVDIIAGLTEDIQRQQAGKIKKSARDLLDEKWDNVQYDDRRGTLYDAGPKEWYCGCGSHFTKHKQWRVHKMECNMTDQKTIEVVLPRDLDLSTAEARNVLMKYFDGDKLASEMSLEKIDWDKYDATEDEVEEIIGDSFG